MNLYNVKLGRVREHGYVVAAPTADKAVDVALKAHKWANSDSNYGRDDLISVTRAIEGIEIEETPLA